ATDPFRALRRTTSYLRVFGRLKPGITAAGARGNLDAVAARLRAEYPEENSGIVGIAAVPLRDEITGASRPMLLTLLAAVAAVLAIACANLSGLWIARAAAQRREMAIRAALGGTRWRLARQTLSEGLVLSTLGAALGLVLAQWLVPVLLAMSPAELPRAQEIHVGGSVVAAAAGAAIVCGLLLGWLPAMQYSPADLNGRGNAGSTSRSRARAG